MCIIFDNIPELEIPKLEKKERKKSQKATVTVGARTGAILQCVEAATLGMPLEVWKTHLGR